jgi:hypothetical protein
MVKIYSPGSTGLEADNISTLVDANVTGLKVIDKLNSHSDIEFSYPVIKTTSTGVMLANRSLICGTNLICGSTIVNQNQNESEYLTKGSIVNKDGLLFIIYDATINNNAVYVRGSDYMNVDALQKMVDNMSSMVSAVSNDKNTMESEITQATTSLNNVVTQAKTDLNNQIAANKTDYTNTMNKIKSDNETYIKTYGVTANFA